MSRGRLSVLAVAALVAGLVLQQSARPARATHDCGLPHDSPLWIEFGAGSVQPEVRAVFARPGVVVAASGVPLPRDYRAKGAATAYFVINLPSYVGEPSEPADPATLAAKADRLYEQAVESTACATPWIALNELLGSHLPTPWSATNAQYRANVLALVERLAQRGARPALLVHGNPNTAGDAAAWWANVGRSASIVYEAYYNAPNISRLGPIVGNRRMRLGMRSVARLFRGAGVPADRIGFMLGFQVAPGAAGREGLQPREEWFRVVKWEALAARQVALDERAATIWSWGWGTFGPQSVDPDKPSAACVYLWARNQALCDGPSAAGPAFNADLAEGQIILPPGIQCAFAGGAVRSTAVTDLTRLTRSRHAAVTALFARAVLSPTVRVPQADVLRAERLAIARRFHGSRKAYVRALQKRHATVAIARSILADELRRQRLAASLAAEGTGQTAPAWTADATTNAANTATCLRDDLPGSGDFPRSDLRDVDVVPLPSLLPFLFADRTPPRPPGRPLAAPDASGATVLDWPDGREPDLAGYHVYRSANAGGPYQLVTQAPLVRSSVTVAPATAARFYVVRSVDSSRNASRRSAEVAVPPST